MHQPAEGTEDRSDVSAAGSLPLSAAIGNCGVGLWSVDGKGAFRADETLLSIWGRTFDELVHVEAGAPACFVHSEDRACFEAVVRSEPAAPHEAVIRLVRADGSERWVLCRRGASGEAGAGSVCGVMLDVTDVRRADQAREAARTRENVAALAGRLTHDFNNLLFAILGNASLALGTLDLPDAHPTRESLREIERAALRASDIVQRLSAFARPGQPRPKRAKVGVLVDDALAALRERLPAEARVDTSLDASEAALSVDPRQLQELLSNLISNAVQGGEGKPVRIRVEAEERTLGSEDWLAETGVAAGPYLELRVCDEGAGMDAETLARAGEPFFTTRPKGTGMGLGLAIARAILAGHGGGLRIESELGRGTTVYAYFPLG